MSDVLNSQQPAINEPLGNSPEARTPDGSIKDTTQPLIPTQNQEQLTDEQKAAAAKVEADKAAAAKKDGEKPTGAPEKYEPFTVPEGRELSPEIVTAASEIFKKHNLSQEAAQEFVDLWNTNTADLSARLEEIVAETRNGWRKEIALDKNLGNGVDNLSNASKKAIADAISHIGDEKAQTALKEALDLTGAGDHPAIVAAAVAWGKKLGEGTAVRGGGPSKAGQTNTGNAKPSAAQAMYPNLPSSANG